MHLFEHIDRKIDRILEVLEAMALDQATFDTELGTLVTAIGSLDSAVDAFIAAQPAGVDLTAEGQSVVDATAAVQAELAKITPAAVVPPVTPAA